MAILARTLSNKAFQIDALDGLRGLAVIIVIFAHTGNIDFHIIPFINFSGSGHGGVFLFFMLSAFLLTYPFLYQGSEAFSFKKLAIYFERRFFRIYPLYFLYLTAALVSTHILSANFFMVDKGLPFSLDFTEYIDHLRMNSGKEVAWSIPVEFAYYFILPAVAAVFVFVLNLNRTLSLAFVMATIILIRSVWPLSEAVSIRSVIYHLPIFLGGSLLAVFHHHWLRHNLDSHQRLTRGLDISGIISLMLIFMLSPKILSSVGLDSWGIAPHRQFLLFAILWAVVIFASIHGNGILRFIFEWKGLRYLGFVSFSAYLLHGAVIKIIHHSPLIKIMPGSVLGWMVLISTFFFSWITYSLIERPASKISFIRRIKLPLSVKPWT
ncbi:MAG: acyltransferase [Desulfobacula sp.]|nr:acyltransferase [Desulfobacula sp.]